MTRTLTFGTGESSKKQFELLFMGFLTGGNQLNKETSRSRDDRKKEAKILRALKAISDPVGGNGNGQLLDEQRRTLLRDGGAMTLEQDQLDLLVRYVEACPFLTHVSDEVDELIDWLHASPREP